MTISQDARAARRHPIEAIVLERHAAVYIETPKVACTSIKTALAPLVGVDLDASDGNPHDVRWPTPGEPEGRARHETTQCHSVEEVQSFPRQSAGTRSARSMLPDSLDGSLGTEDAGIP